MASLESFRRAFNTGYESREKEKKEKTLKEKLEKKPEKIKERKQEIEEKETPLKEAGSFKRIIEQEEKEKTIEEKKEELTKEIFRENWEAFQEEHGPPSATELSKIEKEAEEKAGFIIDNEKIIDGFTREKLGEKDKDEVGGYDWYNARDKVTEELFENHKKEQEELEEIRESLKE